MSTSGLDDRAKLCRVSPSPSAPAPPPNERALVDRARTDAAAFSQLYQHYLPRVHSYAWRRTGSKEAAEDITSSTFEAALRALPSFRWGAGGFAPWLFRIAANQVVAHYRKEARPWSERGQRAMATLTESTVADSFTDLDGMLIDTDQLREALSRLNPRYQRAIDLRYLADLDHDAAAKAMGLAKPALAVVLSRALKALRRELDRIDGQTDIGGVRRADVGRGDGDTLSWRDSKGWVDHDR